MGFINVRWQDEKLAAVSAHLALLDESPVAVLVVDPPSQHVVWASRGAALLLGVTREVLLHMTLDALLAPHELRWREMCQHAQHGGISHLQGQHRRDDGQLVHLQLTLRLGELQGRQAYFVAMQDVGELLHLRRELACISERYNLVAQATSDLTYDWDLRTNKLHWSGGNRPLGYEPGELDGSIDAWNQRIHPDDLERATQTVQDAIRERRRQFQMEYRFQRRDGSYAHTLDRGFLLMNERGEPYRMVGAMADITPMWESRESLRRLSEALEAQCEERRRAAELRAAQLRSVRRELIQVEQRERHRLAQVLHDHLQQLLVAARMRMEQATLGIESPRSRDLNLEAVQLMDQAIREARSLSVELYPAVLSQEGFEPMLAWLANWMNDKHGLTVDLDVREPAGPVARETRITLFHVARELLFNVVKHAGVHRASLRVWHEADRVDAEVVDHGRGFDPQRAMQPVEKERGDGRHFGLSHLRQRMELIGGKLQIHSKPGQGTRITVELPLDVPMERQRQRGPQT